MVVINVIIIVVVHGMMEDYGLAVLAKIQCLYQVPKLTNLTDRRIDGLTFTIHWSWIKIEQINNKMKEG